MSPGADRAPSPGAGLAQETLLCAEDLPPADAKARAALARYRLSLVELGPPAAEAPPDASAAGAAEADYREAFALLHEEFGTRGELEREEVLRAWLRRPRAPIGYKLVVARDRDGALAGVRDCHVSLDATAGVCLVYLAHVLVLPAHRRSGLAGLLRLVPRVLGERALRDAALAAPAELLLAAEMEPVEAARPETVVRLVAYGRAGFRVIEPARLPYVQPDFRDPAAIDADRARRLPLLAVVRRVGHEGADALPRALAAAFVQHLYRIFATHCRPDDLAPGEAHALAALGPEPTVPLLPLPLDPSDAAALAPLARERILALHDPLLLGGLPAGHGVEDGPIR